jgi:tetratricopeptide (TPR) repeat protein
VSAHALLAEIALARGEAERARIEADEVRRLDASRFPEYVEARLLYDQGRFADALLLLEKVIAGLEDVRRSSMPEVNYYAGHAAAELGQDDDAVRYYEAQLDAVQQHLRSRAALAAVHHRNGRQDEAFAAVSAISVITPTPEAYKLAARLWENFGEPRRAAETRAEARRLSSEKAGASHQTTRR